MGAVFVHVSPAAEPLRAGCRRDSSRPRPDCESPTSRNRSWRERAPCPSAARWRARAAVFAGRCSTGGAGGSTRRCNRPICERLGSRQSASSFSQRRIGGLFERPRSPPNRGLQSRRPSTWPGRHGPPARFPRRSRRRNTACRAHVPREGFRPRPAAVLQLTIVQSARSAPGQ